MTVIDKNRLFIICLFTGIFGGHYFAIGKYKKGFLYLFTVGLLFCGWLYDLYRISNSNDFVKLIEEREALGEQRKEAIINHNNYEAQKVSEYRQEGVPYCPKCKSTHLTAQKKGFGLLKGAAGVFVAGPYGSVTAGIGKNKIILTCLNCGYQFKPGRR